MKSILLTPEKEEDSLSFRIRRQLEKPLRRKLERKGIHLPARKQHQGKRKV